MGDLEQRCLNCGAAAPAGQRFCNKCGAVLQAPGYLSGGQFGKPRRQRPWYALWWVWLIFVLILAIGVGAYLALSFMRHTLGIAPHKVIVGQPLAWRELKPPPDPSIPQLPFMMSMLQFYQFATGDFDGDGDDEILLTGGPGPASILEASGAGRLLQQVASYVPYQVQAWDYNGDGIDELLADDYSQTGILVLDIKGQQLATLPGSVMFNTACADFDGDDKLDLAVLDQAQSAVTVYQTGGKELWKLALAANYYNPGYGDIDGDAKAEVVVNDNGTLRIFGMDQQEAQQPGWADYFWPALVADINGDGKGEVFASNAGYIDSINRQFIKFDFDQRSSSDPRESVFVCDLEQDGQPDIVTKGLNNYSMNNELFILRPDGSLSYDERMSRPLDQLAILHQRDGKAYVVVRTESKLLIYP